jgi:hypothetical protein
MKLGTTAHQDAEEQADRSTVLSGGWLAVV